MQQRSASEHACALQLAAPRRLAYWVWLEEIGGRSSQALKEAKMTENHSIPNGSPLGPPSPVLQQKVATDSSPTDRVERLLKKYKVDKIYLSWAQLEKLLCFVFGQSRQVVRKTSADKLSRQLVSSGDKI